MAKELRTAHKVRSISKPGVYLDGAGLRLIVTSTLTKRWELWITINARKRQLGLGLFPQVSLKDARDEVDRIRRAARDGVDLRKQSLNAMVARSFKRCSLYWAAETRSSSHAW